MTSTDRGLSAQHLWGRRAGFQRGPLAATAGIVLLFALVLTIILGFASRSQSAALRETIVAGPASTVSEVFGTDLASSPAKQDAAVRRLITKEFGGAPVQVARNVVSNTWPLQGSSGRTVILLPTGGTLASRIEVTAGSLSDVHAVPSGQPTPVAIDSTGAAALRLKVGDTFGITLDNGTARLRVVAIWTEQHPNALSWVGAQPGTQNTSARLIATKSRIGGFGSEITAQWAIEPDANRVTAEQLPQLLTGYSHLQDAAIKDPDLSPPAAVSGDGASTIRAMRGSLAAAASIMPVPVSVLAISALVALILIAMLTALGRANETRVLLARGASARTIVGRGAVEGAAASVVGAVLGAAIGQATLLVLAGPPVEALEPAIAPISAAIGATLIVFVVTLITTLQSSGAPRPETGRARAVTSWSLAVLSIGAAAVTLWRLLVYGIPAPGGSPDPIGVFAPAAALVALILIGLVALPPLARGIEHLAARSKGIGAVLAARQIGRNLGVFVAPVAVVMLAIGSLTLAAGYTATFSAFAANSALAVNGADVRVTYPAAAPVVESTADLLDHTRFSRLSQVASAAPVLDSATSVGDLSVRLIGISAKSLPSLTTTDPDVMNARAIASKLEAAGGGPTGVALETGARQLSLTVSATGNTAPGASATVSPTVWIEDALGDVAPLALDAVPVRASAAASDSLTHTLPAGGPWKVVAVDVDIHAPTQIKRFSFVVDSVLADGHTAAVPNSQKWKIQPSAFGAALKGASGAAGRIELGAPTIKATADHDFAARIMPAGSPDVPVVLSAALAQSADLRIGTTVTFDGSWASIHGKVVGIVPLVPGVSDGASAIVDLPSFVAGGLRESEQLPGLSEVWIAPHGSVRAAAGQATAAAGSSAVITTDSADLVHRFLLAAVLGIWAGGIGSAAFALVALAAALASMTRRRQREITVFTAIGFSPRQQVAGRRNEVVGAIAYAVALGIVSGMLVAVLVNGVLVRLSVAQAPLALPIPGHVDLIALTAAVLVLVVVIGIVVRIAARGIRSRARTLTPGDEA